MKVEEARFFENTLILTTTEKFAESEWGAVAGELLEVSKKFPYILIYFKSEIDAKIVEALKLLKKKFTGKSLLVLASEIHKLDAQNKIDGLKCFKHPTAKRILDILKLESDLKEVELNLKSTDAIITNQITDLLKLPMPDKPFTAREVDIHLYNLNKEVGRLNHTTQVFFKEIDRLKKNRPKETDQLLKNQDSISKLESYKAQGIELLKEKKLVS